MGMDANRPASLEEILCESGFCPVPEKPPGLASFRHPKDNELGNIVRNRLSRYWLLPEEHELVPVFIRKEGKIKPALHNGVVWVPLTLKQAEVVAWYLRTHLRRPNPLPPEQQD